jgi:hypothetical protein
VTQGCVGEKFSAAKEVEKQQLDLSRCVVLSKITPKEFCTEKAIERALREIGVTTSQVIKAGNVSKVAAEFMACSRFLQRSCFKQLTQLPCSSLPIGFVLYLPSKDMATCTSWSCTQVHCDLASLFSASATSVCSTCSSHIVL